MYHIDSVEQKSIAEVIAENIKKAILSGELEEGTKLREQELCRQMNVSRTPIREAYRILQAEGYLTYNSRIGVFVTKLSKKDVDDIYEVRSNLEQLMAEKTAVHISEEQLKELRGIVEQLDSLPPDDRDNFFHLDDMVHDCLVRNCKNEVLKETVLKLRYKSYIVKFKAGFSSKRARESIEEHKMLLKAFEDHDPVSAGRIIKLHFEKAQQFYEDQLKIE